VTQDAIQATRAGYEDGFVCRFSPNLATLTAGTYIGGGADGASRYTTVEAVVIRNDPAIGRRRVPEHSSGCFS
jgi:hypothetical protein